MTLKEALQGDNVEIAQLYVNMCCNNMDRTILREILKDTEWIIIGKDKNTNFWIIF